MLAVLGPIESQVTEWKTGLENYRDLEAGIATDFRERMSYGGYLRLAAQQPLSGQHDELLFIVQHQVSEMWLKLLIHELRAALAHVRRDELEPCFKILARVKLIQQQLFNMWAVLETLTPSEYAQFRPALGQSSGFQSFQYRTLEFLLGNKHAGQAEIFRHDPEQHRQILADLAAPSLWDEFQRHLARRGFAIPAEHLERDLRQPYPAHSAVLEALRLIYRTPTEHWDAYEMAEKLLDVEDLVPALGAVDLVVISQFFFANGHLLADLPELVAAAHAAGTRILLDVYHGYGILPLDLAALDVDYAVAGSYKYLRGGPGSCWLYVSPQALRGGAGTLDTGWFARRDPFAFTRGDKLELAENGDGWLESTFPPLVFHQSRAGLTFTAAVGVERLRAWNLRQKALLSDLLAARDIPHLGRGPEFGAFLTLPCPDPQELVGRLKRAGLNTDARSAGVRLCPDLLTTDGELEQAAELVAACR